MDDNEVNNVEAMVDDILASNFTSASDRFEAEMGDRINTTLDQSKIAVANALYNDVEDYDDEEELEDVDVDDLEITDELDEVESEDDFDESDDDMIT